MMINLNKLNIFNKIHQVPLMDERHEKLKKKLYEKYNIDYLAINVIDKQNDNIISIHGHDNWHNYIWDNDYIYSTSGAIIKLMELKENENGVLFFNTYFSRKKTNLRAEIIGERKSGCSIAFNKNNRILFCITFKDNTTINEMDKKVFFNLVNDLYRSTNIFDSFMMYFKNIGNLINTEYLEKEIKKDNFILTF